MAQMDIGDFPGFPLIGALLVEQIKRALGLTHSGTVGMGWTPYPTWGKGEGSSSAAKFPKNPKNPQPKSEKRNIR